MRWRSRTTEQGSGSAADPLAAFADGTMDPDQLDDSDLALVDRELEAGFPAEGTRGLATLVEPPENLRFRVKTRVDRRILGRKTALTCADLIGTAWRTVIEMFGPSQRR